MKASGLAADLLNLFLPAGCLGCRARIPPEERPALVCPRCRTLLRPPAPPCCSRCQVPLGTQRSREAPCLECRDWPEVLLSARAAAIMEPPADALVHALKYGGWRALGDWMGVLMAKTCPPLPGRPLVIPVPTTPSRMRVRGYNQAEILARVVARVLGLPLVVALARSGGGTQVKLGPKERRANVEGCFSVPPPFRSRIRGCEVILIDDVLTTAATARSAALALEGGGAGSVRLLTFARALPMGVERRLSFQVSS